MWEAYTRCCNLAALPSSSMGETSCWRSIGFMEQLEVSCPPEGQIETMQHARFQCKSVDIAFRHISTCFQAWTEGLHSIKLLLDIKTAESLLTPIGALAWTALYANCKVRNTARASPEGRPTDDYFFRTWMHIVSVFKFKSLNDSTFRQCFKSHCIVHPKLCPT